MKRLTGSLLIIMLASLACSLAPQFQQSDFPIIPSSATQLLDQPTQSSSAEPPSILPQPTNANTNAPDLTVEQLRNATLLITGMDKLLRIMTFKDGKYEQGTDPAQAGYASVSMGEKIAFGDLNADGLLDAVISIGENYGGSGVFVSLVAILNDNGQPKPIATIAIEDRPMINELKIDNGEILVDVTVHAPNDPLCCPSQPSTRVYRLIKNNLELARLSTKTPNGAERVIQISSPANNVEISGPFNIKGSVTISPFENTLVYKVFQQGSNEVLDQMGFIVNSDGLGGPGTFELNLDFSQKGFKGPLRIEIADLSAADGSILAQATLYMIAK